MRILITGGAGFIGSAFCRLAVGAYGVTILNVDKLTYAACPGALASIESDPRYGFRQVDICNQAALEVLFSEFRPDAVVHMAAESHVDRSIAGPGMFIETNVVGTYTLLEAALGYWRTLDPSARDRFRFLHVSTDEVYGSLGEEGAFTETTPYDPRSPYSASKAASDHLVSAWGHTYGLPILISNCSNNYGPFQFPEKLIPLMVLNSLEGRPLPVYGDGSNIRDWLFVEDHVHALMLMLGNGRVGETYNVGGRNERSNIHVVQAICDLVDARAPTLPGGARTRLITYVTDRPGHDRRYAIDATKLETELGWRAQESFETGLARTIDWYLANEGWWRPILQSRYDRQRLGLTPEASR